MDGRGYLRCISILQVGTYYLIGLMATASGVRMAALDTCRLQIIPVQCNGQNASKRMVNF